MFLFYLIIIFNIRRKECDSYPLVIYYFIFYLFKMFSTEIFKIKQFSFSFAHNNNGRILQLLFTYSNDSSIKIIVI